MSECKAICRAPPLPEVGLRLGSGRSGKGEAISPLTQAVVWQTQHMEHTTFSGALLWGAPVIIRRQAGLIGESLTTTVNSRKHLDR